MCYYYYLLLFIFYNTFWLHMQEKNSDSDCEEILDSGQEQPGHKQVCRFLSRGFNQHFKFFTLFLFYVLFCFVFFIIRVNLLRR